MLIKVYLLSDVAFFRTVIVAHIFKHNQREQSSGLHMSVSYVPTTSILSPFVFIFPLPVCLHSSFLKLSCLVIALSVEPGLFSYAITTRFVCS